MNELAEYLIKNFNIINSRKCCVCNEPVHRLVVFYEYTLHRGEKEIATLGLCKNHYKNIDAIIKEMKAVAPGKILGTKTLQTTECEVSNI